MCAKHGVYWVLQLVLIPIDKLSGLEATHPNSKRDRPLLLRQGSEDKCLISKLASRIIYKYDRTIYVVALHLQWRKYGIWSVYYLIIIMPWT